MWADLPIDVIHIILKYTGKVLYRDGKYININKLGPIVQPDIEKVYRPRKMEMSPDGGWYYQINFENQGKYRHGLCYDYNFSWSNTFEVCYFIHRPPLPGEGGTAWVQIRTLL